MKDDINRKNDNNLPFIIMTILLTLAVLAGGMSLGWRMLGKDQDSGVTTVSETESEAEEEADTVLSAETEDEESNDQAASALLDITGVVKNALPSIVAITSRSVQEVSYMFRGTMEIESESSGSGIIVGQSDTELLVATNYHVIQDAQTLTVCFSVENVEEEDAVVEAVVKGSDEENDLAVLAVDLEKIQEEVLNQITIAELGSSEALVIGEPAIAIGNALGYGQSVTLGIVSALNRSIEVEGETHNYIQTDAAINAGNSGGALLNINGEVIGINSAKVSSSGVEGMGYAIPIDDAQPILAELMDRETRTKVDEEERGYLGVYTQDISSEARDLYDIPNGVYIFYVVSGSPAENAGLQRGDIISAMDHVMVSSAQGFDDLLEYYRAGETVAMEILRSDTGSYESQTVNVTFSQQPEDEEGSYDPGNMGPSFRGGTPFGW